MVKNVLAAIGVLAIVGSALLYNKMAPMMDLMSLMSSEKSQPMLELLQNNPEGLKAAIDNLNDGAAETATDLLRKWIESKGDIAATTTWAAKVEEGVEPQDVIDAISSVATEMNIKSVGNLPLSEELKARGIETGKLYVMSYCNPETARKMVDFSPAMAAYLPCRVTMVEQEDGLWLYSLNMDMMIKMGAKMPPELVKVTKEVRDTIWSMLERGAAGDF